MRRCYSLRSPAQADWQRALAGHDAAKITSVFSFLTARFAGRPSAAVALTQLRGLAGADLPKSKLAPRGARSTMNRRALAPRSPRFLLMLAAVSPASMLWSAARSSRDEQMYFHLMTAAPAATTAHIWSTRHETR